MAFTLIDLTTIVPVKLESLLFAFIMFLYSGHLAWKTQKHGTYLESCCKHYFLIEISDKQLHIPSASSVAECLVSDPCLSARCSRSKGEQTCPGVPIHDFAHKQQYLLGDRQRVGSSCSGTYTGNGGTGPGLLLVMAYSTKQTKQSKELFESCLERNKGIGDCRRDRGRDCLLEGPNNFQM